MKNFIVYDIQGKILRTGICRDSTFYRQANDGEFVMEGRANDATQKIINAGVKGKIINRTPQEIETDNPITPEIPESQRPAHITNEQLQDVLKRLKTLETIMG